jgi:methylated-DNA-[protein]-cysteine S-methyltransferase
MIDHIETPIGRLAIVADDDGRLRAVGFTDGHTRMEHQLRVSARTHTRSPAKNSFGLTAAFARYFAGDLTAIDALPVAAVGTAFQQSVWSALRNIPCGETVSYGDIARRIGRPKAVRAVGLANGSNPIAIVVPCHRVIGANGSLTGYGGGLDRKRWLLTHERVTGTSCW